MLLRINKLCRSGLTFTVIFAILVLYYLDMKKIVFLLSLSVIMIAQSACNKDYTCVCTDSQGKTSTSIVRGTTQVQAQTACADKGLPGSCQLK